MKKIFVYENDVVNVYEVNYDQEYMNISLDEYRKKFSLLRKGKVLTKGECSSDAIKTLFSYFNEIVDFGVSVDDEDEDEVSLRFIGSVNPVIYSMFVDDKGNFLLDVQRVNALVSWYESISQDMRKRMFPPVAEAPINDFSGLNEREEMEDNIATLLDGVSLELVDKIDNPTTYELYNAKKGAVFVDKFNINVIKPKIKEK